MISYRVAREEMGDMTINGRRSECGGVSVHGGAALQHNRRNLIWSACYKSVKAKKSLEVVRMIYISKSKRVGE